MRILTAILGIFILVSGLACTAGDQFSSKNSPDDDRPSEDGETVPGYLTYIDEIGLNVDGNAATVFAGEGTVVSDVPLTIQVSHLEDTCVGSGSVGVRPLGAIAVMADGSFEGQVTIEGPDAIVLSLGQTGNKVRVQQDRHLVSVINFRDGSGFKPLAIACDDSGDISFDPVTTNEKGEVTEDPVETDGVDDPATDGGQTEISLTTAEACQDANFFWDPREQRCELDHPLVPLKHCYPNPDVEALESLIEEQEYENAEDDAAKLEEKLEDDYTLLTCYQSGANTDIKVVLLKDDGAHTYKITLPFESFADDLQ